MQAPYTVLVTDDDAWQRAAVSQMLGKTCNVAEATDGETCLKLASELKPALILLDVDMPGLTGYETCQRLKADDATREIPVMFVSAMDAVEDRLRGYDAGGEDYVVKPFHADELKAKIDTLLTQRLERVQLKEMVDFASRTAMVAMSSMGEMGTLMEALRKFSLCTRVDELADRLLDSLSAWALEGAVQIRAGNETHNRVSDGSATPLLISVISNFNRMDRITQFKSRLAISYPNISLLVSNLPVEDSERCGRLRDHLAHLVELAEFRLENLLHAQRAEQRARAIERVVQHIRQAFGALETEQAQYAAATQQAMHEFSSEIETLLVGLALTEKHEEKVVETIKNGVEKVLDIPTPALRFQEQVSAIIDQINSELV